MGRKVLIFGATGEIGGRIAHLAVKAGHKVIGATRSAPKDDYVDLSGVEFIHGNKYDDAYMEKLSALKPEVVIDTLGNIDMAKRVQRFFPDAENVMFCSSTGTFVPLQWFPADETHPWQAETPVNFFHQSQWDTYALNECTAGRLPITILRPTNIIGETRVPLELWGGRNIDFFRKLKNNEPVFVPDILDITLQSGYNWDLASAFVLAMDHPEEVRGEIFIISCKKAVTLGTYLDTCMNVLGSSSEIIKVAPEMVCKIYPDKCQMRYGMEFLMQHMCFDIGKAERMLGYAPEVSTEEGLTRTLNWMLEKGML